MAKPNPLTIKVNGMKIIIGHVKYQNLNLTSISDSDKLSENNKYKAM
jgi:hypothetical protein